ncbi:MAG: Foldase protein PrsA [Phycisphaerae bacterium]|nr:Foldase protein PrsA [Phycisphaerae bacterium]
MRNPRSMLITCLLATAWLGGCVSAPERPISAALNQPTDAAPAAPAEAAPDLAVQLADVAATDPVARVNGQPISRERLCSLLIDAYGREMLQALVALEVVKQAAAQKGVTVTAADLADERSRSFPEELKKMPPGERGRLLDDYLARNGLTHAHWELAVERNAYLRKLSQDVPRPTEEQLREVFKRKYGEKVQVRHMQLATMDDVRKATDRLKSEPFEKVVRDLSTNERSAANGGLLPPFTRDDSAYPEPIRQVAFGLKTAGEVSSPVIVRGEYHLLQLVKLIPAEETKFDAVRDELAGEIHDGLVRQQMNQLLRLLPASANIEILDPAIKAEVDRYNREHGEGAEDASNAPPPQAPK